MADEAQTSSEDPAALIEAYYERGWTDGLPVVPPSDRSLADMLAGAGIHGDEIVGEIPDRGVVVTAEKLAINAIMDLFLMYLSPLVIRIFKTRILTSLPGRFAAAQRFDRLLM